jgi:hypothetical protein
MKISHSAKEKYLTCAYSYFLHYMRKIRTVFKRSSLTFGDAIDFGLNTLLETRDLDKALIAFHSQWAKNAQDKSIKYSKADLEEHLIEGLEFDTQEQATWKSLDIKGELLIREYNEQVMPRIKEVIKVQIEELLENEDKDFLTIKTDFICVWEDGRRILFDNKTSSVKYDKNSVKESGQLGTYFYALKDEYRLDTCGYIVTPKKTNKKKKPVVQIEVIIDDVSEATVENTMQEYQQVLDGVKAAQFPKNKKSCIGKFGKCDFYDYCHSGSMEGLIEKEDKHEKT